MSETNQKNEHESIQYPFQNPELPRDERLDNLLSLLSIHEKISFLYDLSPGIPRSGY